MHVVSLVLSQFHLLLRYGYLNAAMLADSPVNAVVIPASSGTRMSGLMHWIKKQHSYF